MEAPDPYSVHNPRMFYDRELPGISFRIMEDGKPVMFCAKGDSLGSAYVMRGLDLYIKSLIDNQPLYGLDPRIPEIYKTWKHVFRLVKNPDKPRFRILSSTHSTINNSWMAKIQKIHPNGGIEFYENVYQYHIDGWWKSTRFPRIRYGHQINYFYGDRVET